MEHQGRLAGAVGAEDRDALAVADVQVDAGERDDPVGIGVAQVARVDGAAHARDSDREQGQATRRGRARRRGGRRACPGAASPVAAAREHRQVHALPPLVGAQEERGRDAAQRRDLERVAGRVAAGEQRGAHPRDLFDDHEQVAVHEARDQDQQRGTLSFSSACSTSGKLVVAPSSTAESVPSSALALTVANVARLLGDVGRVDRSPAAERDEQRDEQDQRQHDAHPRISTAGGTRASAATSTSVGAQAA